MNDNDEFKDTGEMNDTGDRNYDALMARAKALPAAIRPERDLWPEIEQAITATSAAAGRHRPAWNTVWAQAAAVLLLVGGSSGLTYLAMTGEKTTTTVVGDAPTLIFEPASGSFGSQYNLGPDYQDARRDLVAKLENELDNLPAETRTAVLLNMETIRHALDEINTALAQDPDNVLLQEMLINTYRSELSLMMKIDEVSRAAMRRGDI